MLASKTNVLSYRNEREARQELRFAFLSRCVDRILESVVHERANSYFSIRQEQTSRYDSF